MRGWRGCFQLLVLAYLHLDEHERALEAAQRYRETFGDDLLTLYYEGLALAGLGRVEEVNAPINEIVALPEEGLLQGYYVRRIAVELLQYGHTDADHTTALDDGESAVTIWQQAVSEGVMMLVAGDVRWIACERLRDYEPWQELTRPKG